MNDIRCGLQLYSVRHAAAADFGATLAHVGTLGLDGVELAGLHGHDPARVAHWLAEARLSVSSIMVSLAELERDPAAACELAAHFGCDLLVIPSLEASVVGRGPRSAIERLSQAALQADRHGCRLAFHNHTEEFRITAGRSLVDLVLERAPDVCLEIDLGWAWQAGQELAELLQRAAARTPLLHLKDFAVHGDHSSFTALGEGVVPFDTILPVLPATSVSWLIAEQDANCLPDELAAAARSADALNTFAAKLHALP